MRKYIIDEQLLTVLIDYLSLRPYREVYQLIDALQLLRRCEEEDAVEDTADK